MKIITTPTNCSCFSSQMGVEKGHKTDYFFYLKSKIESAYKHNPPPPKKNLRVKFIYVSSNFQNGLDMR